MASAGEQAGSRGTPDERPEWQPQPWPSAWPAAGEAGSIALAPVPRAFSRVVRPPGSKSLTNRALLLAALASGESHLIGAQHDGEDAAAMARAISVLGARVQVEGETTIVSGTGARWAPGRIDVASAGTGLRFLAASALLADGPIRIDASPQLRARPIGELAEALKQLGCAITWEEKAGSAPLTITPPPTRPIAPTLTIGRTASSQFISGLLMLGPFLEGGITLRLTPPVTSASYVRMTLDLLASVGATVQHGAGLSIVRVAGPLRDDPDRPMATRVGLEGFRLEIEPDASGATYFWAAAAIVPGSRVFVPGLGVGAGSVQGDAFFPDLLDRMGAKVSFGPQGCEVTGPAGLRPLLADMSDMPDAALTLAAVACFAKGTTVLRGLTTLRVKESDRIAAMRTELAKIGVTVAEAAAGDAGAVSITPPPGGVDTSPGAAPVAFDTYDDHRVAMALALIGLRRPGVTIRGAGCVAKTYPGFWRELSRLWE